MKMMFGIFIDFQLTNDTKCTEEAASSLITKSGRDQREKRVANSAYFCN